MNPLSRAMKMVRLAKKEADGREPANQPLPPSELLQRARSPTPTTSDETRPDDSSQPLPPFERLQRVRSSTPTTSDETRPDDGSLNDISLSDLIVFNDVDSVMTNHDANKSLLNCYLPPVKGSILNRGNLMANVPLGSDDLALLEGAANVQGPVEVVDGIIPQELEHNTDIVDLDNRDCNVADCEHQLEWETNDHSIENEEDNIELERNIEDDLSSRQLIVECHESIVYQETRSATTDDGQGGMDGREEPTVQETRSATTDDGQGGMDGREEPTVQETRNATTDGQEGMDGREEPTVQETNNATTVDGQEGMDGREEPTVQETRSATTDGQEGMDGREEPTVQETNKATTVDGQEGMDGGEEPTVQETNNATTDDGLGGMDGGEEPTVQETNNATTGDGQGGMDGGEEQTQENNSVSQEVASESTPRSRKRKANKDTWKKNINKNKRDKGEAYMRRTYEKGGSNYTLSEKPAKLLGDRCSCKTTGVKCREVTDETRQNIHKEVWAMSWPQRNVLIKTLVHRVPVGRHRVEQLDSSRSNTLRYHLNAGTGLVPVCKKMFISTTGITQHLIRSQVCEAQGTNVQTPETPGTSSSRVKIREFLMSLPTMPSHYCRKSSSKKYTEPVFNSKAEVHNEYKKWCAKEQITPSRRQVFEDEFDTGNYALFQPRKDQCDLCVSYSEGNVDEESYILHRQRKEQAQRSKEEDKQTALASNGSVKMLTMDLQSVLLAPSLKASALYYKTKLCVHNYTIYDATTKDVTCYVWHEVEGGLTANEFASCLCYHLSQDQTCKEYILFSDGYPYQNRNSTLSKALTLTAQKNNITITHKFLEKGHTQMEVDSVHHTIEAKLKNKMIYCPSDYVRYMTEARQKPFPYKVEYLSHTFFKDFTNVCSLKSIRPGKKAGDPQVTDIRCLQYTPDGKISYKLDHEGAWQDLDVRGNSTVIQKDPKRLLLHKRKIPASKYKHLQELKHVIPQDFHAFYDALPHD